MGADIAVRTWKHWQPYATAAQYWLWFYCCAGDTATAATATADACWLFTLLCNSIACWHTFAMMHNTWLGPRNSTSCPTSLEEMDKLDDLLDLADAADIKQNIACSQQTNQNAWGWVLAVLLAVHGCCNLQLIRMLLDQILEQRQSPSLRIHINTWPDLWHELVALETNHDCFYAPMLGA